MNEKNFPDFKGAQWLPCLGISLTPENLSVPDRLEKFGYTVILDRSAASKIEKAELCVHDVLMKKMRPNIIIFCPLNLIQCWYDAMLYNTGTEFKYLNLNEKEISFFNEHCSNMFISDYNQLYKSNECMTIQELRASKIVWDLVIIDLPFSVEGADTDIFISELKNKTEKLLICSPMPSKYNEDCGNVYKLIKHLLYNREQANDVERYPIDVSVIDFNPDYPVLRDEKQEKNEYRVITLYYTIDEAVTPQSKRIDDIQTGIPVYTHGGNIFEEYSLEERKVYLRRNYNNNDVDILCTVDKKLEVFIKEIKKAVKDSETIIVYAVCENTVEYLYKTLSAIFEGDSEQVGVFKENAVDFSLKFRANSDNKPRILVLNDNAGWCFNDITEVTHIFNYEYPDNPAVLQMRYLRRGLGFSRAPAFYIFIDNEYRFDGRVLRKSVLGSLHLAFHRQIPSKNIIMYAEDIDKHITALLLDLKFISRYTGEVGSSFETVTRFRTEYNISGGSDITTAARAHEKADKMLKTLSDMLNITEILTEDERSLHEAVVEKVSVMRSCYAYFDDGGRLRFLTGGNNSLLNKYADSLYGNRFVKGAKQAEAGFKGFSENDIPSVRKAIEELSDTLKMSALFSLGKLCTDISFEKLMLLYNRGMI